ncbi:MAG: hypothetical protein LBS99_03185 [Clostridiales bacterium]|jgi:hypothetical protein|nr:hypothetical protein [Clostridiales bacterium]
MAIEGTYNITVKSLVGKQAGTLVYKTEGDVLTGSMSWGKVIVTVENGKIDGDNFEWTMNYKTPMGVTKSTVTGIVDGDDVSGKFKAGLLTMPFSGARVT